MTTVYILIEAISISLSCLFVIYAIICNEFTTYNTSHISTISKYLKFVPIVNGLWVMYVMCYIFITESYKKLQIQKNRNGINN
jgi:bacteriorhodopsin